MSLLREGGNCAEMIHRTRIALTSLFPEEDVTTEVGGRESEDRFHPNAIVGRVRLGRPVESTSDESKRSGIVGGVTVQRRSLFGSSFGANDRMLVEAVCGVASAALGLKMNIKASNEENSDVDVEDSVQFGVFSGSTILKFMAGILPPLLAFIDTEDRDLIAWTADVARRNPLFHAIGGVLSRMRRLCGADNVKLYYPSAAERKELYLSSDDKERSKASSATVDESTVFKYFAEEASDGASDGSITIHLGKGRAKTGPASGELKVIYKRSGIDSTQHRTIAKIGGCLISATLHLFDRLRSSLQREQTAAKLLRQMEVTLDATNASLTEERGNVDTLRGQLSSIRSITLMVTRILQAETLSAVASEIEEVLPKLSGYNQVRLYMMDRDSYARTDPPNRGPANSVYNVIHPIKRRNVSLKDTTEHASSISLSAMKSFPLFTCQSSNPPPSCVIYLRRPNMSIPFAVLVLTMPDDHTTTLQYDEVTDELLEPALSIALATYTDIYEYHTEYAIVQQSQSQTEKLLFMITQLEGEKRDLEDTVERLASSNEKLRVEIGLLESERIEKSSQEDATRRAMDEQLTQLTDQLQETVEELRLVRSKNEEVMQDWDFLISLCREFVVEGSGVRARDAGTVEWLGDIASRRGCKLALISRAADGLLAGGLGGSGVLPVASESMRSGMTSVYRSPVVISPQQRSVQMSRSRASNKQINSQEESVIILNIPNRHVAPLQPSPMACFQFCRQGLSNDAEFSAADKIIFEIAVGLVMTSVEDHRPRVSDIQILEKRVEYLSSLCERFKEAVVASERVMRRSSSSRAELTSAVETAACTLLTRGEQDPCTVHAYFWIAPSTSASESDDQGAESSRGITSPYFLSSAFGYNAGIGFPGEAEAAHRAYNTGTSQCNKNTIWSPICNAGDNVLGLLRVERRLNHEAMEASDWGQTLSQDLKNSSGISLADILITTQDEEVVTFFCTLIVPLIEKVRLVQDVYDGVQQASKAIRMLQQNLSETQDKLAIEMSKRLSLGELIDGCTKLLDDEARGRYCIRVILIYA